MKTRVLDGGFLAGLFDVYMVRLPLLLLLLLLTGGLNSKLAVGLVSFSMSIVKLQLRNLIYSYFCCLISSDEQISDRRRRSDLYDAAHTHHSVKLLWVTVEIMANFLFVINF